MYHVAGCAAFLHEMIRIDGFAVILHAYMLYGNIIGYLFGMRYTGFSCGVSVVLFAVQCFCAILFWGVHTLPEGKYVAMRYILRVFCCSFMKMLFSGVKFFAP